MHFVEQNKNETKSKIENPTHSFRETNLVNRKLKKSCDELELSKEKRSAFFGPFTLFEGIFF